jgi:hypothetical protein
LTRAGRVSDHGREMDDGIYVAQRNRAGLCVAHISMHELEVGPSPVG